MFDHSTIIIPCSSILQKSVDLYFLLSSHCKALVKSGEDPHQQASTSSGCSFHVSVIPYSFILQKSFDCIFFFHPKAKLQLILMKIHAHKHPPQHTYQSYNIGQTCSWRQLPTSLLLNLIGIKDREIKQIKSKTSLNLLYFSLKKTLYNFRNFLSFMT